MRCCRRIWCTLILLTIICAFSCSLVYALENNDAASADETVNPSTPTTDSDASDTDETPKPPPKKMDIPSGNEDDWGSFYDPNNVFCGKYDCYKILGFDHETWGANPPSLKDITKSYRGLSRRWHPDKNKAKGAREKFVVSYKLCT